MIISINDATSRVTEAFLPDEKEREFILKVYNDFIFDYQVRNQIWEVLNNRTLTQFWQDSNYDYNNIVEDDPNDPVTQYSSGISRDKANTFISNLTLQLLYPSVTAQNQNQEIDHVVSKVSRSVLEWQYVNDGRPSESGELKNTRYTHKQVIEGTVHIQDDIDPDTGRLVSSVIPNEEVYIPNFYQPDIQLQSHFIRVTQFASFQEVEAEFGECENFKYVAPGNLGWLNTIDAFKERYKATVVANQTSVIRCWYPVSPKDLKRFKAQGKLPKWVTKAKYFNVLINGVPMFPVENLMPYYHGCYPITKGVFEYFSPSEFYWGNSMPNKCRQDKKFIDGWKTLIRYKAKLGALPPLLNFTGQHIDGDIIVPGNIADLPGNFDPTKITTIPGISNGITNGDIQILKDTTEDVERATAAPQVSGQQTGGKQTARETMIIEQNAQKAMMGLAQQIAFVQEARAYPILKSSFQFLPRQDLDRISIPHQTLSDGKTGNLEIVFKKLPKMTKSQVLQESMALRRKQDEAAEEGITKRITVIDTEYIQACEFYCKAIADSIPKETLALRKAEAELKWQTYSQRPDIFNVKAAARKLVREYGDDESELIVEGEALPQAQGGQLGQLPPTQGIPTEQTKANPLTAALGRQQTALSTQSIQ